MGYLLELFGFETNYILTAFNRLKGTVNDNIEMCSHSHEKDFFYKHDTLIRNCKRELVTTSRAVRLLKNYSWLYMVSDEKISESLILEFQNIVRNMGHYETILWCASLLINFHKKEECSKYLTLAMKFKLILYYYIDYMSIERPTTVMKTMMEFLDYISLYKCEHKLFIGCLNAFTCSYAFNEFEDHLQPALLKVLQTAHKLNFNFFSPRNIELRLETINYPQLSLIHNVERFLLLVTHGYQDKYFYGAMSDYMIYVYRNDMKNLFGYFNKCIHGMREERIAKYRPFQVLALYMQADNDYKKCGKEVYDKVLYILWETITDPYLTQELFISSFEQADVFPEFLEVWKWYSKIVLRDAKPQCSPRALKHIARCTIRRILTESVQFPHGVDILDIPQTLKSYLRPS